MKSSRAYVASRLELPAVTVAERASSMLLVMAAAFAAYVAWRQDITGLACICCVLAASGIAGRPDHWRRDRRGARRWLESTADGTLHLHQEDMEPMRVRLGPSTRLLGASLVVDIRYRHSAGEKRSRCWLTPLDLPREVLRRWTIVLLAGGRVART